MSSLFTNGKFQAFDANGDPLASGKLYTYAAGTSTPLATYPTYADSVALTNANANPVIMDSAGRANVWLGTSSYRMLLKTSADSTIWDVDSISNTSANVNFLQAGTGAVATTVQAALRKVVHTDQYSSDANYRIANDALRTGKTGVGGLDVYAAVVSTNSFVGRAAGNTTNTGTGALTALGSDALTAVTTGDSDVAIGSDAMRAVTTGVRNVAVGYQAMSTGLAPRYSVAVGNAAGLSATSVDYMTAVGYQANLGAVSGLKNTAVGAKALLSLATGDDNTAVGFNAGQALNAATGNVAVGAFALENNVTANNMVAVGYFAGQDCAVGPNVFVGRAAGGDYTTGTDNTFVGYNAGNPTIGGSPARTGVNNVAIGSDAGPTAAGASNTVCIGQGATAAVTGNIAIGRSTVNTQVNGSTTKIGLGQTDINVSGRLQYGQNVNTVNNNAGVAYSNTEFLGPLLLRTGAPGGGFSDTTAIASQLVSLIPGCEVGTGYDLYIHNTTGQTMTMLAGAGITLAGTTTVATGQTRLYKVRFTNVTAASEAATVYGVFTAAN